MSDIDVYLTTSKYAVLSDLDSESFEAFKMLDVPVCVSTFCMLMFNSTPRELEKFEHRWAQISKDMAKTVIINSEKCTLYIGEEPENENGALIQYCEKEPGEHAKNFFKRWEETKQMMLEFNINGHKNETLFCLKGLWANNEWKSLDIQGTSKISII